MQGILFTQHVVLRCIGSMLTNCAHSSCIVAWKRKQLPHAPRFLCSMLFVKNTRTFKYTFGISGKAHCCKDLPLRPEVLYITPGDLLVHTASTISALEVTPPSHISELTSRKKWRLSVGNATGVTHFPIHVLCRQTNRIE